MSVNEKIAGFSKSIDSAVSLSELQAIEQAIIDEFEGHTGSLARVSSALISQCVARVDELMPASKREDRKAFMLAALPALTARNANLSPAYTAREATAYADACLAELAKP